MEQASEYEKETGLVRHFFTEWCLTGYFLPFRKADRGVLGRIEDIPKLEALIYSPQFFM